MTVPLSGKIHGVPIAWASSPFASYGSGEVYSEVRAAGLSIAEMVRTIPDLPDDFAERGVVCINGDPVPRALWAHVRPKPTSDYVPVAVTLHCPLGKNSGQTLALVASIAVLIAATAISGGLLAPVLGSAFAAGGIGATLLSTGVSLAGSLLIAALTPPPVLAESAATDESKGSANADGNVIEIGGPLPRVCGTFKVFPPLMCEPLIDIDGDNEVVTAVYGLAGPHAWSDIRVGGTPVDEAEDITSETREGWLSDPPLTLVDRQTRTETPQIELTEFKFADSRVTAAPNWDVLDQGTFAAALEDAPVYQGFTSRDAPDEVWLHLYLPGGLNDTQNATSDLGLPLRIQFRARGTATWYSVPEVHLSDVRTQLLRRAIKFVWGAPPSPLPTPPSRRGWVYAFKAVRSMTSSLGILTDAGWSADGSFSSGIGSDLMQNSSNGNVIRTALYRDRVEFYLDPVQFPQGQYEFQIKRGSAYRLSDFTQSTYQFGITAYSLFYPTDIFGGTEWSAIRLTESVQARVIVARVVNVWNEAPVALPGLALLVLQATNRSLSQVSALASGYVRDWNTTLSAWQDWTTTSNPAAHYRDVLAGDLVSRQVPAVNDTQIVEWRTRCAGNGYTFDGILDGRAMGEALNLLAAAGYARPRKSERWGVIIDQDRSAQTPQQIFNPRNLANFRMEKAFADLPDGFIVTYRSAEIDYQPTQVVVYRNGFEAGNARRLEAVDYIGPVTEAAAVARATFDLRQAELRSTFYYADADIEALVTESGDLVGVQHDVIDHYAGFAYIKSVLTSGSNVTGLVLDSKIPLTTPDDISAVQDVAGLANVEGAAMSEEISELVDISAEADITLSATATIGVAIRCKDGTILTKAVIAETADDHTFLFAVPFADPGTSVLAAGCLVQSGLVGQEYHRLILREARPGRDGTAALTFIDEANELWLAAA